ncbi:hypothetical protein C2E21_6553 [Chlorella sorokiniana]|uniref:Uncharacterized protein n=1 Tax=Chlorella sorokiniana TaxID=3076 RepID=A0A2P6TJP1_CHLSO|nr:hypothetical protein C2E21_6553 [Chlorella sorokiniana]|eukprot:PRW44289.1 hypothetical protein C2E21_6553 [Chlorella sorokiniana]
MPSKLVPAAALAALLSLAMLQPAIAGRALRDSTSDAIEKTRQCLNAAIDSAQAVGSCTEEELTTQCVQDLSTAVQDQGDFEGCANTLKDIVPKLPALVGQPIKDAVNTAASQVSSGAGTAIDAVKGAASTATGAVADAGKAAGGAVVDAGKTAGGAITDAAGKVGSAFQDAGSAISSGLSSIFG